MAMSLMATAIIHVAGTTRVSSALVCEYMIVRNEMRWYKMILAVASGKGGTGKTTVAVNLAITLEKMFPVQLLDCDVEEPDCHLFLRPVLNGEEAVTISVPDIDESRCDGCGRCSEICAFHAILVLGGRVVTFPELCHGCGGCSLFCPSGAISEMPVPIGVVESGKAGEINFVRGRLRIGSALAPPVIKAVKRNAAKQRAAISKASEQKMAIVKGAEQNVTIGGTCGEMGPEGDTVTIIDSPPGTSCPVVNSVAGADFCLLVTEPTPFGLNDLTLAVGMVRELQVPFGVVVNRVGLGESRIIRSYCEQEDIPILLEIPFSREYAGCYARGGLLAEEFPELREAFEGLWLKIGEIVEDERDKGASRY